MWIHVLGEVTPAAPAQPSLGKARMEWDVSKAEGLLKPMVGPAGCGAQGWCYNEGADNVLQGTNSWRGNKNEWVGFRKELRREHRHFWRGLEPLNPVGKKIKKASSSLPTSLCYFPEIRGSPGLWGQRRFLGTP